MTGRPDEQDVAYVTEMAGRYPKLIEIMRIAGTTKQQAKQGFSNMVDELWDAALAEKCKHASRYRAIRPPRCNGGNPCNECRRKWAGAHREYVDDLCRRSAANYERWLASAADPIPHTPA